MTPQIVILIFTLAFISSAPQADSLPTTAQERVAKAEALFRERCQSAGEKIYRTADKVEGIFLMKLRPEEINYANQYRMDDPYGHDSGGETYLKIFFTDFYRIPLSPPAGWKQRLGYPYVEALDPQDGKRYRYTGRIEEPWQTNKHYLKGYTQFVLDKKPANGPQPRYGVTYDDISTREDRDYWIAGSSLKVIDLKTNEVMAERIGYMMDRGQGSTAGGRSPWLLAADNACPSFPKAPGGHTYQTDQTHDFVLKVLKPSQEK